MVFVEVGSPYILAGAQTVFSCRSVWQIFMSMQCCHCLHASERPEVNSWTLDLVVFALDSPFQGDDNGCAWSLCRGVMIKQQQFFWGGKC